MSKVAKVCFACGGWMNRESELKQTVRVCSSDVNQVMIEIDNFKIGQKSVILAFFKPGD